jgi:hypothetical protein
MSAAHAYPAWPPGLWRRIVLQPGPGWIAGALEDDIHRFHVRLEHDGERIERVLVDALRHPWSACPGAGPYLVQSVTGRMLTEIAAQDPLQHCTHVFDLALACAAHAHDPLPHLFDMRVADRVNERTTATMEADGVETLRWQVDGTMIAGSGPFAGRDLRKLSQWKHEFPAEVAEQAAMLRRAIYVSGARKYEVADYSLPATQGPIRVGACYNYQRPQAETSTRRRDWRRDWSLSDDAPLGGFDPMELAPEVWDE